jgi:linoleoyl-CoA desaturase
MKLSLPNKMTDSDQPARPEPPAGQGGDENTSDYRRRLDSERPSRRRELGGWSRSPAEV